MEVQGRHSNFNRELSEEVRGRCQRCKDNMTGDIREKGCDSYR
jgi:hypothetical protein